MQDPCPFHRLTPPCHGGGFVLMDTLCALALAGVLLALALPQAAQVMGRYSVVQASAMFEHDWRRARFSAQQLAQTVRLQAIDHCLPSVTGWPCGWQTIIEATGQVLHETRLPAGLVVTTKPSNVWRIDAWGEPLSGGASILFQPAYPPGLAPQLLCMNVLGRLRRLQGQTCTS
jgi:Tfp pilus assembly protein FimT